MLRTKYAVLDLLRLRGIWRDQSGECFDFTRTHDVTTYVLCVRINARCSIESVEMES